MKKLSAQGRAALIIGIAFVLIAGVSLLPLEEYTGGAIKNFNPFADIMNSSDTTTKVGDGVTATEVVDPMLQAAMEEDAEKDKISNTPGLSAQASSVEGNYEDFVDNDTVIQPVKSNKEGSVVTIEDYTTGNVGLSRLKFALGSGRVARIALVGDSYIEGDIFAQNLREDLQDVYGGEGVGYVSMMCEQAGFRRSIKHTATGWTNYASIIGNKGHKEFLGLSELYSVPKGTATSTYKGVNTLKHLSSWTRSRFLFIAPNNTTISVKTDGDWENHEVTGSTGVQSILIDGNTSEFSVKTTDPQLIGLGVWLDGSNGVSLDCMSSRGYSGITLNNISTNLCRAMSKYVDYDLIILEFGINAMSANQSNYNFYANKMVNVVNHIRTCYPNADILMLGIGDRGQKKGSEVHSMSVVPNMIAAQRDAARRAHCLFWDTREAMGGEDAIVRWSSEKLANKDYIHLTHAGGEKLASLLFNALQLQLKK